MRSVDIYAPDYFIPTSLTHNLETVRRAVGLRRKLRFHYQNLQGVASDRVVRPLGIYFWGTAWSLVGWCEMWNDFRNFRPDRMSDVIVLDQGILDEPGTDLATFLARMQAAPPRRA